MSKYTTELRFICESLVGLTESVEYSEVETTIAKASPLIFNFKYPIFNENYKEVLQQKIIKHFYTREIGFETVGLWKLKLNAKLNEIMPYYNQLYESELLEFNPLYDTDLTIKRDITRDRTENTDTSVDSTTNSEQNVTSVTDTTDNDTSKNTRRFSATPQGSLQNIESNEYLTDATIVDNIDSRIGKAETKDDTTLEVTGETNTSSEMSGNDIEDFLETVKGKRGGSDYSEMLQKYRKTFLNIDMMVIEELEDLFMQLW